MAQRAAIRPELKRFRQPRMAISQPIEFEWGGVFEKYARGFVSRNQWRTKHRLGDTDDAMQEAAIIFWRCVRLYRGRVTEPRHMMALFKLSLANDWNTFARQDARLRDFEIDDSEDSLDVRVTRAALRHGNEAVQSAVKAILEAPQVLLSMVYSDDNDENINRRMKRFLKSISPSELDLAKELRQLLDC